MGIRITSAGAIVTAGCDGEENMVAAGKYEGVVASNIIQPFIKRYITKVTVRPHFSSCYVEVIAHFHSFIYLRTSENLIVTIEPPTAKQAIGTSQSTVNQISSPSKEIFKSSISYF